MSLPNSCARTRWNLHAGSPIEGSASEAPIRSSSITARVLPAVQRAEAGEKHEPLGFRVQVVFADALYEHAANGGLLFDLLQVVGRRQTGDVDQRLLDSVRQFERAGGEVILVQVKVVRFADQPDTSRAGHARERIADPVPGLTRVLDFRQVDAQGVKGRGPRVEPATRQATILDLQNHGAAIGLVELEPFERAEAGPGRSVRGFVGVAHDGVVEAGGGDLVALERGVPVLALERGVPFLAVEHGDVRTGALDPESVVEEAGGVGGLAVGGAPDGHTIREQLRREARLGEDVDVVRPVEPPVRALRVRVVMVAGSGEDLEFRSFEHPSEEVDRVRRHEFVLEEVAADQHRGSALMPGLLERPGHAFAKPLALPPGDLPACPAELRVQVNVAEGEELHAPGLPGGALAAPAVRVTPREPRASSRRPARCSGRGPRATAS